MYLIVFDCDGTLADSQDNIMIGFTAAYRSVDLPVPSRDQILSTVGLTLNVAFEQLLGHSDPELIAKLVKGYQQVVWDMRSKGRDYDPLYDGALEALNALAEREDVLLGVATGKHSRGMKHLIGLHGLEGFFTTMQTADVAPSKPNPGMIFQAMSETGVDLENTIMIGDTTFDMQMARNAGVESIGVTWGYHSAKDVKNAGASYVIDHFNELIPVLSKHFSWNKEAA
ncbi:Pyrophosphatase PpaX [Pseudovibrio axinellae]|uniref:Pyrophosphatase PpaX n=1 Tax=Pseudovibrio axinellae TaxID=989403 RepID=A0A166AIK3_9HYPH|nr:HAD-IA family hydrolase [Pseudovibrio axinellae]KZL21161.1 Pyrophosphatase PpaX [Pseudovibrio axinellae]SEQ89824.1 phosphoglycolate phosphatase [Pseudovibrio axinellae]